MHPDRRGRRAVGEGHAPRQFGRQPVVVTVKKAADAPHRVADGDGEGARVHDHSQALFRDQRDDDHSYDGAEQAAEPDQATAAEEVARPFAGMQDEVVDLGAQQAADHGCDEQTVDEIRPDAALLELPMGDEPGSDEGQRHHKPERVHGEPADMEQHRVHQTSE